MIPGCRIRWRHATPHGARSHRVCDWCSHQEPSQGKGPHCGEVGLPKRGRFKGVSQRHRGRFGGAIAHNTFAHCYPPGGRIDRSLHLSGHASETRTRGQAARNIEGRHQGASQEIHRRKIRIVYSRVALASRTLSQRRQYALRHAQRSLQVPRSKTSRHAKKAPACTRGKARSHLFPERGHPRECEALFLFYAPTQALHDKTRVLPDIAAVEASE